MVFVFGDYELDTARHELRGGGELVHVEPQVFAVLAELLRHRDRVVTRDELLDRVWGHRFVSDTTLASRIKAARRAIGDSGAEQRVIRTVRGTGFRFVGEVAETDGTAAQPVPAPSAGPDAAGPPADAPAAHGGELRRLRRALTRALAGERRLVIVAGAAGAGKSTLAARFAAEARALPEVRVTIGQCVEHRGEGEPYLPVLDAIARLCEGPGGEECTAVMRTRAPTWVAQLPWLGAAPPERDALGAGLPDRMLREMVAATEALAAAAPLVLVLEDLHWSDPSTVDLVAALARRAVPARLLVVATHRSTELPAGHPLAAVAAALVAEGVAEAVELPPLTEPEIAAAVARRCPGAERDRALLGVLGARTGGNPLFLRTLLDEWIADGALSDSGDGWHATRPVEALRAGVPESARRLVEAHVDGLPGELREALDAASVAGPAFSAATVAAALDVPVEAAERRCAALARDRRLLVAAGSERWGDGTVAERFRFPHDLHREVVYDGVTAGRRATLHARSGRRLEAAHGPAAAEIAAELADHFVRGGDDERAVRWSRVAAERALGRGARREAVGHLRAALGIVELRPDLPDAAAHELALLRLLAPALVALEGWAAPEPERAYRRARELATATGRPASASAALYGLAVLHEVRGEYPSSQALLEQRLAEDDPADEAAGLASHELLACSLFHQGAFADALAHAERGQQLGGAHELDPAAAAMGEHPLVSCTAWMSLALWALDAPDEALERAREAVRLAGEPERAFSEAFALVNEARLHQLLGDAAGSAGAAARAERIATVGGPPYLASVARIVGGWARAQLGDAGAPAAIRAALDEYLATGARMDLAYFLGLLAEACLATGAIEDGLAAAEEGIAMAGEERPFFYEPELWRARAELLARSGDLRAARAARDEAIAAARRLGSPALERRAAAAIRDAPGPWQASSISGSSS